MSDHVSAEIQPLVSREQVENAFHKALCMFVGRGKRHRAEDVATGAGIHRRTLDCYRGYPVGHPDWRPLDNGQKFSIASYVGADLTAAWIGLIGQGAFNLPDIEPDPGELAADNSDDNAVVVRAAIDGKFDRQERAELKHVGARMVTRGAQLVAAGRRAA